MSRIKKERQLFFYVMRRQERDMFKNVKGKEKES